MTEPQSIPKTDDTDRALVLPPWTTFSQRREEIRSLWPRETQHFHILGGGVAALAVAAEILSLRDGVRPRHRVTIYEASDRVGGRIHTRRLKEHQPGMKTQPYFERGAMRIPDSHDYTWALARELGLQRRPFSNATWTYFVDGKVLTGDTPQAAYEKLVDQLKVTHPVAREDPGRLFAEEVLKPLEEKLDAGHEGGRDEWVAKLLRGQMDTEALQDLDGQSVERALVSSKLREPEKRLLKLTRFAGLLDRSMSLFVRSQITNYGDLWELCLQEREGGPVFAGMDLLTRGLESRVREQGGTIRLNSPVIDLASDGKNQWAVRFAGRTTLHREGPNHHLLCTIPFAVMRDFDLRTLSEPKRNAIQNLSVADATKVALRVKRHFWGVLGGRTLGNGLTVSSYYPNHGTPEAIPENPGPVPLYDLYTQPLVTPNAAKLAAAGALEDDAERGPWLLLASYTFGEQAREWRGRGPGAAVDDLAHVFGKEIRDVIEADAPESEVWYWSDKETAKTAFALPEPNNIRDHYMAAVAPDRGVYFAGDHLSPEPGWIQGALFSALRSLRDILRDILRDARRAA